MSLNLVKTKNSRSRFHDVYVPKIGVCNLCRAVALIDDRETEKHHVFGRMISRLVLEVCSNCHLYEHAIEGTRTNNAPKPAFYALNQWFKGRYCYQNQYQRGIMFCWNP